MSLESSKEMTNFLMTSQLQEPFTVYLSTLNSEMFIKTTNSSDFYIKLAVKQIKRLFSAINGSTL